MIVGRGAIAVVIALLVPSVALAYSISLVNGNSGNVVRWGQSKLPWRLHSAGSADIVDGSDLAAIRAGWKEWEDVSCSALSFQEGPETSNKNTMAVGYGTNGQNEITWAEGSEWQLGQFVLGVTNTSFSVPDGVISEADIAFNGYQNTWSTNEKWDTIDVLNVAVHEQGHFFGAHHVLGGYDGNDPPTMAPTADPDLKSQTIEPDDEQLACFLYPQTKFSCSSDDDCPLVVADGNQGEYYAGQLGCKAGLCGGFSTELPEGDAVLGEACASEYDCVEPLFCQPTGTTTSVCAKNCTTAAQCGSGFDCYPYSNASGGVCLPGEGSSDGGDGSDGSVPLKDNGEPCFSSTECSTGLCVGSPSGDTGYCRSACQTSGSCASGEVCTPLQNGSGACLPEEGGTATSPAGAPCDSPVDCISGLCVGDGTTYQCRDACETVLGNCPESFECFGLTGGGGACFPDEGGGATLGLGVVCESSDECASGVCIGFSGDDPFCSAECSSASCPCGMDCTEVSGGESYCIPGAKKACIPSGNACKASSECVSGLCDGGICEDFCDLVSPSCPSGQSCRRSTPGSASGICENVGPEGTGAACGGDADCQTNLCELGECRVACTPGQPGCGPGQICRQPNGAHLAICVLDDTAPVDGADASSDDGTDGAQPGDGTDATAAGDGSDGTEALDGVDGAQPSDGVDGGDGAGGDDGGGADDASDAAGDDSLDEGGRGGRSGCSAGSGRESVGLGLGLGAAVWLLLGFRRPRTVSPHRIP